MSAQTTSKRGMSSLIELVLIVAVALGLALGIQAFVVKPYRIPSPSMVPTLQVGQRVLVNRLGNSFSDPHVGEIVVFHPPQGADNEQCGDPHTGNGTQAACDLPVAHESDENFIKRVVAGPGDTITIRDGHPVRNGRMAKEDFIAPCDANAPDELCNLPTPIKVPPGHWFMMGDNRGHSADSRYWGPVPKKWIIGGAFATYWPPGRIGIL